MMRKLSVHGWQMFTELRMGHLKHGKLSRDGLSIEKDKTNENVPYCRAKILFRPHWKTLWGT